MLRVYIDVDGTILYEPPHQDGPEELDFQLVCDGLDVFLDYVIENCEAFWLTYRARLGYRGALEEHIFPHLPRVAASIPVAYWDELKTEAIDPKRPFLWFDDSLEREEADWLESHGLTRNFIWTHPGRRDNPIHMVEELKRRLAQKGIS